VGCAGAEIGIGDAARDLVAGCEGVFGAGGFDQLVVAAAACEVAGC